MSTRAIGLALALALIALTAAQARAQEPASVRLTAWHVRDGIYMIVGAGGNTTVQVGDDGVLVVDTKLAAAADVLLDAIRQISDKPIRYIINTHWHLDHVGSNELIAKSGSTIAGGNVSGAISDAGQGAAVIAHENVLVRMSGQETPPPFAAWPTDTLFMPQKDLYFNDEAVEILHQPAAHTDGDTLVFFRRSDVVVAGDVINTLQYPSFDAKRGGSIQGILDGLNEIIDITVPRFNQQGGTMVIPGHGRLSNESDVDDYRNWMTIVRDRVQEMIRSGKTLAQIKAAKPTLDFDGVYANPKWTTDQFIEAVYRDLSKAAAPARTSSN